MMNNRQALRISGFFAVHHIGLVKRGIFINSPFFRGIHRLITVAPGVDHLAL
jgi:hypothetical protein